MSSTAVIERPIFKSSEYLADLVRRNRAKGEPAEVGQDVPPHAPTSAFITGEDEVIECEEVGL